METLNKRFFWVSLTDFIFVSVIAAWSYSILWMCQTHQISWNFLKFFTFIGTMLWCILITLVWLIEFREFMGMVQDIAIQSLNKKYAKGNKDE